MLCLYRYVCVPWRFAGSTLNALDMCMGHTVEVALYHTYTVSFISVHVEEV